MAFNQTNGRDECRDASSFTLMKSVLSLGSYCPDCYFVRNCIINDNSCCPSASKIHKSIGRGESGEKVRGERERMCILVLTLLISLS